MSEFGMRAHAVKTIRFENLSLCKTGNPTFDIIIDTDDGSMTFDIFGHEGDMPELIIDADIRDALTPTQSDESVNLCDNCGHPLTGDLDFIDCPKCGTVTPEEIAEKIADDAGEQLEDEKQTRWDEVMIGDRVRSFDFANVENRDLTGVRAAYVIGTVTDIQMMEGCDRYCILIDKRVWGDEVSDLSEETQYVYPPVNGTPTSLGGICNGVELIERPNPVDVAELIVRDSNLRAMKWEAEMEANGGLVPAACNSSSDAECDDNEY